MIVVFKDGLRVEDVHHIDVYRGFLIFNGVTRENPKVLQHFKHYARDVVSIREDEEAKS